MVSYPRGNKISVFYSELGLFLLILHSIHLYCTATEQRTHDMTTKLVMSGNITDQPQPHQSPVLLSPF